MSPLLATIIFGLAASLCWGSGDFSGGLASRRAHTASVVFADYGVGFVVLVILALIWKEPFPSPADTLWGGLAGLAGMLGLLSFYTALSTGKMGIVAPVSAVLTATLPIVFSAFTAGLPTLLQIGGLVLALLAIGLISRPERTKGRPKGIGLALLAGCGFGCFFILISRVNPAATFWPLAVARFTAILVVLMMVRLQHKPIRLGMAEAPLVALSGILGAVGNTFFLLAAHSGRLDIATILSSLYPAATVGLSALVLRERATPIQAIGILLVLLAVPMISA
jgi:drug/metabolite transporter (DMT)-like permease